ncbi:MAG: CBS domain-containing protein [Deltaproteobacteria bacterium]|jgi:CBS-domain-containing membrane protein|nr:CBS domain-containing protein [Deltaproteobacteria bacterium]
MLKARDIMTKEVITVSPDMEITKAAKILLERRINGLPVVDAFGRLVGIVCQSDLVVQQKRFPIPSVFTLLESFIPLTSMKRIEKEVEKIAALTVKQAMTTNPVTVGPDTDIEEVARLMVDKKYHTLPVVEDGKVVGIVGKEDVLKTLLSEPQDTEEF